MTTERIYAMVNGRIGVLMGGLSSEREVSLESGAGVLTALTARGHDVVGIEWEEGMSLPGELIENDIAVVWNALHGTFGEDGAVQGLLTCMRIPYTGSGILASALAMDKIASKRIFEAAGLVTPRSRIIPRDVELGPILADLKPPLAIKPALEGSSVGVSIVMDAAGIEPAIALARRHRGATLVEDYIAGSEIQVAILGDEVLGSVDVRPAEGFYDYQAKYKREDTRYLIPPPMDPNVLERVEEAALTAHRLLGCSGYSRVDTRVTPNGEPFVLEVNTLPGMTSHSLVPKIAAYRGIGYTELCERILALASV